MAAVRTKKETVNKEPVRYTREQLLKSKRYRDTVDILSVVLDDYSVYTTEDTDKLIIQFLRGKVK